MNRDQLIDVYMDWLNDYLTIEVYADHHSLSVNEANTLIELARSVFNSPHPDA